MEGNINRLLFEEIASKMKAIQDYNGIIWKIRSGVMTLIFLSWGYVISGILEQDKEISEIRSLIVILVILTMMITAAAFVIDLNYIKKKYKVINAYDQLSEWLIRENLDDIKVDQLNDKQKDRLVDFIKTSGNNLDYSHKGKGFKNALKVILTIYGVLMSASLAILTIILFFAHSI